MAGDTLVVGILVADTLGEDTLVADTHVRSLVEGILAVGNLVVDTLVVVDTLDVADKCLYLVLLHDILYPSIIVNYKKYIKSPQMGSKTSKSL